MAKRVEIGGIRFSSMKEAKAHATEIKNRVWKSNRIKVVGFRSDFAPIKKLEDRDFLRALVRNHPDWSSEYLEAGAMITGFAVAKDPKHGNRCLWLSTADSRLAVRIGIGDCITGAGRQQEASSPKA
jgi:hypothetical protein